jgi:hypothetical protein
MEGRVQEKESGPRRCALLFDGANSPAASVSGWALHLEICSRQNVHKEVSSSTPSSILY